MFQISSETQADYAVQQVPHNREAEEAVIGSVMINPDVYAEAGLRAEHFYITRNAFIWTAFDRLNDRGKPIDFLTVSAELDDMGRLDEIGGPSYLTAVLSAVPTSLNADEYAEIVREKWTARIRLQIANALAAKSYSGDLDIARELDALTKSHAIKRGAAVLHDDLAELVDIVAAREANPGDKWGVRTGLPDFDNMTGGLQPQEVTLIAGKPEAGKTTLMLQMALEAARSGSGVAIYELEMDKKNILMRLITLLGGPTRKEMMRGKIPDEKKDAYWAAVQTLDKLPLYISDNPTMTTMQVGADLARLQATRKIDLVCLDYLDLLADSDGKDSIEKSILRSRRFRQVCRERNVSGLSVQSLNKAGIAADNPGLADVSGPGGVLFDADQIFILTTSADKRDGKLSPVKMRYGENRGIIPLVRDGMRFGCATRIQP